MRRTALMLIGFLALAGLTGYLATSGLLESSDELPASARPDVGEGGGATAPGFIGAEESARDGAGVTTGSVSQLAGLPTLGSAVIRTGSITVEVGEGGFGEAFDAASLVAGRYGGYVQSSSMAGTRVRSGDLLLRVPADRFDQAMSDLRDLGTVARQSVSGEDVSAQFVDLQARLRTWQAQEAVLLDLMGRATTIEETIRVQVELQNVQLQIEEVTGQLSFLEDRTEFATIQVSLREPGGPAAAVDGDRPSLGEAWERAVDGFLGVCYSVVVGIGYLIPITLLAGAAWLGYRRLRVPRAPAATP
jgi:hypothetical protein